MIEIETSHDLETLVRDKIRFDIEEVWVIALSSRLTPLAVEMIFRGHATGCPIHPREIFRFALREGAVSIALAHSHPSGSSEPSFEDIEITRRLFLLGKFLGIPLIDHLVLSQTDFTSLADEGHFSQWKKLRSVRF